MIMGDDLGEMLMKVKGTCPKCNYVFTFQEGVNCIRKYGINDKVVMCPKCEKIYTIEMNPSIMTLIQDVSNKYNINIKKPEIIKSENSLNKEREKQKVPKGTGLLSRLFGPPDFEKLIKNNDYDRLVKLTSHHDTSIRRDAISALGSLGDKRAANILLNILSEVIQQSNLELQNVIEKSLGLLAVSGPEEVAKGLDCENKKVRVLLCNILSSIDNLPKNLIKLVSCINILDAGPDEKRLEAFNILGELKDRKALPAIAEYQTYDSSPIKISALKTLGKIGDERALKYVDWLKSYDKNVTAAFIEMLNELPGERAILDGISLFQVLAKYCVSDESLFLPLERWLNRFDKYCNELDKFGKAFLSKIEFPRKAFEASSVILKTNESSHANNNNQSYVEFFRLMLLGLVGDSKHPDIQNITDSRHPARKQFEQLGALCVLRLHFEKWADQRPVKTINKKGADLLNEVSKICPENYTLQKLKPYFPR